MAYDGINFLSEVGRDPDKDRVKEVPKQSTLAA
jgi:hypothetical protein